jgi:N-acetylmuramoyl-L-alanine amidase
MGVASLPVVVLDPGHGGTTTVGGSSPNNATGPNGLLEKNLTLDLAQRVAQALADEATVILTRTGDTNLSLSDRAQVGQNNNATIFLSIHFNGFHDTTVDGTEVWVANNASQRSRALAQTVLDRLLAVTGARNRGVREEDFGVLLPERHAPDSAVCLAEIAFLTNPDQARRLAGNDYRQQLAEALATAVRQHLPVAVAHGLMAAGQTRVQLPTNGWGTPAHYRQALGTSLSNAAVLEWVDLTLIRGSDGQPHLFYLTSGDPDRGRATFRLKVTNTNAIKNFQNTSLKLRLSSRRSDGTFRTIPLPDQRGGFLTLRSEPIEDESSRTIPIVLENATLLSAYHPDEPFKRLEVEFHWSEKDLIGWSHYYNRTTLAFYLFHPVEFLFDSTGRPDGEVRFNDPQYRDEYWIPIREKVFTETDRSPVTINLAIQTELSRSDSSQISITTRTEAVTATGGQVGGSSTTSASLGVEKVIKAGVSAEDTRSWSLTWNQSLAREFATNVVRSRAYTTSWTTSRSETVTLDPAPAGQIRALYAYPIFQRVRTNIVYFGRTNALGQATARHDINDFPVLRPSHWGYTSRAFPAAQARSVALGAGVQAPFTLSASVGDGGRNVAADVRALKEHLISLGYNWLVLNSTMDAATMRMIRLFQSIIAGRNSVSGDGRVDVPGTTYGWLRAANAPRWQLMPAGSAAEGFVNDELADTNDQHDYGTDWLADTLRAAAADYLASYLASHTGAALLTVNDASLPQGGDTPDHAGHETGLACDLKLPRTDGRAGSITTTSATYDRAAARAQLQALRRQPLVSRVLLNDAVLIGEGLCIQAAGHDNHIHFEIRPPAQVAHDATAQSLGQAGEAAVSAETLIEATVRLAGGNGSLLRSDFVQQQLRDRAANSTLNRAFTEALQSGASLANMAQQVVREIERQFILDPATSSLDLLPAAQRDRYRRFAWGENDYPGGDDPPAANEGRAREMARDLSRIRPERRPNQGGSAVVTEAQLAEWQRQRGNHLDNFWRYVSDEMQPISGQNAHKLNRYALASFSQMAAAAAADGVTLTVLDADRSPATSQRAAAGAGNRAAVARFSSHNLGLAVDLRLSHGGRSFRETTTRPMQNVVDMRESPVHKWLFLRGAAFGWFPYQNEPWHWEYNPSGFRARFFANWTGTVPGSTAQASALNARTVTVHYDVPLVPQPDKLSCWAGAMAMLISYRRQASFPVEVLAESVGRSLRTSYGWDMLESVKDHFGFRDIPIPDNMSYVPPPEDWHAWLRQYGPLWVTVRGVPSHAIIVTGLHGDLTPSDTSVNILDPRDLTTRFDRDPVEFNPPNFGRRAELPYTRFAAEFINIDVLANVGDWRILYLPPQSSHEKSSSNPATVALGGVPKTTLVRYGVPDARITDPFYRNRNEKERQSGRRSGRERHLGIDVSLNSERGGGADDPRRGLPVYAVIQPRLDIAALNQAAAFDDGAPTTLAVPGQGTATLANALVLPQPWRPNSDGAYGGVLGLACRYDYTRNDGRSGRFTLYVEFLHLITADYLPKDGQGRAISPETWQAMGKGIGFGPSMGTRTLLSAADLQSSPPLLVGYLGASEFPHVHIQVAYRDGEHAYLRAPRLDPAMVIVPELTVS